MTYRHDLLAIASRRHGVLSAEDLRAAAVTPAIRRRMIQRGELIATGPNAHRLAGFPTTGRQAVLLACLELKGVASHQTAATLSDLGAWGLTPIHILSTRTSSARHRSTQAMAHTTTNLPADDVTVIDGIPCTSVARTLLLLAGDPGIDPEAVRNLVDAAVRDGKASDPWLWWRLERLRCRGRGGVTLLEEILTARAGGEVTESWLERRFLAVVAEAGLPVPACQQRVDHRGSFVARVDFLYPASRLVIEVLGHAFHSTPEQLRADAERRARLQLAGYRILEFTYDQIVRTPELVIAMLAEALELQPAP